MSQPDPGNPPSGGPGSPSNPPSRTSENVANHAQFDEIMARASQENFPVALRILPHRYRRHLQAIYGYARLVDNLGDEYPGDRLKALDWLEGELDALFSGTPSHPVLVDLLPTVAGLGLPRTQFDKLLEANRMDQRRRRYANWNELMEYCDLSANPVGRLVLAVFEVDTPDRRAASDSVCSGLQVLEHCQDVGEDARAGRIYLPADDLAQFGCTPQDLTAPSATPGLKKTVERQALRATAMVEKGQWLVHSLRGHARIAVSGYVAGGLAGLDALKACGYDVLDRSRQAGTARLLRRYIPLYLGSVFRRGGNRRNPR